MATVSDGKVELLKTQIPTLPGSITSGSGIALVRPEAIKVSASLDGDGKVFSISFLGAVCRVVVNFQDGSRITAQIPSSDTVGLFPGANAKVTADNVAVFVKESK